MHWEKKICIRLTIRRIVGTILAASTVANLIIAGAVFGADSTPAAPMMMSVTFTSPLTFTVPAATRIETSTSALVQTPNITLADTPGMPPTETFTPIGTSTPTESHMDVPGWPLCIKKFYWPSYYVKPGDTLFSLASATGSTVRELISANCLANDRIYAGQLLYVPRIVSNTATITATGTPTDTATPTSTDIPTATSMDITTETPTATQTPTDTATATPTDSATPIPSDPTYFLNPRITFVLCSEESNDIFFSVMPYDLQGVRSVSVFYDINGSPKVEVTMGADGDTFSGWNSVAGIYSTDDAVHFYFIAIDGLGDSTESIVYKDFPSACPQ